MSRNKANYIKQKHLLTATFFWGLILVLAMANGILREAFLLTYLSVNIAYFVSGCILAIGILLVAYLSVPRYGDILPSGFWIIGGYWLILTVIFEFALGYFITGATWSEMLDQYRFKDGNIWPLILIVVVISPVLASKIRGKTYREG